MVGGDCVVVDCAIASHVDAGCVTTRGGNDDDDDEDKQNVNTGRATQTRAVACACGDFVATDNTLWRETIFDRYSGYPSRERLPTVFSSSCGDDGDNVHDDRPRFIVIIFCCFFFCFFPFLAFSRCTQQLDGGGGGRAFVYADLLWRRRVVGKVRAEWNRSGPCACAGGGGARPIGWLLPCAVAGRGPIGGRPRRGNRRSNRFPLIENSCCGAPLDPAAHADHDAPSTPPPARGTVDQRGGKRAKNRIPPRAATRARSHSWCGECGAFRVSRLPVIQSPVPGVARLLLVPARRASVSIRFLFIACAPPPGLYDYWIV